MVKLNKLDFLVFLLILAVTASTSCVQQKIAASEILEKMQEKYESVESYRAEIHQKDIADGKTAEVNYTIYFKKPDKFRTENPKVVTVWTSKVIWIYDKQKNEVRVREINASNSEPPDFLGFILNEIKKYNVSLEGQEKVNGKECYLLDLNTSEKYPSQLQRVWVVKGEWSPAKLQFRIEPPEDFQKVFNLTLPKESTSILEFRKMELNAEIPDEIFSIPENVNHQKSHQLPLQPLLTSSKEWD